jgi:hypothetical protein
MKKVPITGAFMFATNLAFSQSHKVKKIEFEKNVSSWVEGESEKSFVTFKDGVNGYLFYSKKYSHYYVSNGTESFPYKTKDYALDALWEYKEKGTISKNGSTK